MWIGILVFAGCVAVSSAQQEPTFETPVVNVTVVEGATAVLPCSVSNIGRHKVAWTDQWSTLLAFMDTRIIDDERISVDRPFKNDWNLHIAGVKYDDQGIYNCQVNTKPVKIQTVVLNILVPPRILGSQSNSEVIVKEGQSVNLVCNVSGIPRPTVTWYKRSTDLGQSKESEFCPATSRIGFSGEILLIHNVTRFCGGTYECVADNGVPPAVKRALNVGVEFSPQILIHNKKIGQVRGKTTILECVVTAFPQAVSVWRFNNRDLRKSKKYHVEVFEDGKNKITLSLRIANLIEEDYGQYTCVASNSMGRESKRTLLYEHIEPTQPPTTTTTTTVATTTSRRPSPIKTDKQPNDIGYDGYNGPDSYKPIPNLIPKNPFKEPREKQSLVVAGSDKSMGVASGSTQNSVLLSFIFSLIFTLLSLL